MSAPMQPIEPELGDNDDTAELPVLDVASYEASLAEDRAADTDTWVLPQAMRVPPPSANAPPAVPVLQPVPTDVDLGALSATLRAVEDRLRIKSERLVALEREISDVRNERTQALANNSVVLADLESQRHAVTELQAALSVAQARAVDAEARAVAAQARAVEAESAAADLQRQLVTTRTQAADAESRVAEVLVRNEDLARRQAELEATLRVAESTHEAALIRVNTDIALHREQLAERSQTLGAQITELEAALEQATSARETAERRARELEADFSRRANELEIALANRETQLQREFEHKERNLLARIEDRDADMRAAEESIRRLESELRHKTAQLEDVVRTSEEFRNTIVEAQAALSERDQHIRTLETQLASTATVFGQLQQSIERLDPVGVTGEEVALEGPQRLLIRTDGNTDYVHVLNRRTRIGRAPDNDLQIDAKYISRNHAVLLAGPINTTIEDLGSTNGVFVNGKRITRQALKDGDKVTIGRTQFRYSVRALPDR